MSDNDYGRLMFMAKDDDAAEEADEFVEETEQEEEKSDEFESEEDVYQEDEREKQAEEDAISPVEDAFMEGYDEDENVAECTRCKKSLLKMKGTMEREYKGKHYRFCSEKCAKGYKFGK